MKEMKEKEEKKPKNQLEGLLNEYEDDHYNFGVTEYFQISTGSMKLDAALDGGLPPGIHRFGGSSEGGKTSASLEVLKNFLETVPNSKGIIVKAEGRLSEKLKKRSGIKFVTNAEDWVVGTCFVFKCNVYDVVAQFIYDLVKINSEGFKYGFVVDSLDGLILKSDQAKTFTDGESVKVCGPNVLTKLLFKKLSLPISELGHLLIVITQIIASIPASRPTANEQLKVSGGGGNASIHFSSFILTFQPRYRDDIIVNDGKVPNFNFGESNIIGHWAKVKLEKTENEKSNQNIRYPIKYTTESEDGRIWTELEIREMLEYYGFITIKGSWFKFSDNFAAKMKESGIEDIPAQIQGAAKFDIYVCEPDKMIFCKKFLKEFRDSKELL